MDTATRCEIKPWSEINEAVNLSACDAAHVARSPHHRPTTSIALLLLGEEANFMDPPDNDRFFIESCLYGRRNPHRRASARLGR